MSYLAGAYRVPVSIVTFDVFEVGAGERVLVRELTELDEPPQPPAASSSVASVCARADANGIGGPFRQVLKAATEHGLSTHPYRASVKYAAPSNPARTLFTVWVRPIGLGHIQVWIGAEAVAQFYQVTEDEVVARLGPGGWRKLSPGDIRDFTEGLHHLFARMNTSINDAAPAVPPEIVE